MTVATVTRIIEVDVRASAQAQKNLAAMAGSMGELEKTAKKTQDSFGNFASGFGNMIKATAGFLIFDQVAQMVYSLASSISQTIEASTMYEARMKLVTSSTNEAKSSFGELVRITISQGREMASVALLYEKVSRNAENLGVTQRGVSLVTEGFAASLRLSGAGTQEATASMTQFAQALASGKLAGDEFKSIMENNSVFLYELAKAAGVTMGQLRKMSSDGKLDAEFLREAMFKLGEDGKNVLQRMMDKANELPFTFAQAKEGIKASLVDLVNAMQGTADKTEGAFTRMLKAVTESVQKAAQSIRDEDIITAAIDKALGLGAKGVKEQEVPDASKRMLDMLNRKAEVEKTIAFAEKQSNPLTRDPNRVGEVWWAKSDKITGAASALSALRGELEGISQVLGQMHSKQAADDLMNPYTTPGKLPKALDKEKKGPKIKEDSMVALLGKFREDEREFENLGTGIGKNMAKAIEASLKSELTGSTYETMKKSLFATAKNLDAFVAAKQEKKDAARFKEESQRDMEMAYDRSTAGLKAGMEHFDKMTNKEDAFSWLKAENEKLDSLIALADELGKPELVQGLERYGSTIEKIYAKKMAAEIKESFNETATVAEKMGDRIANSADKAAEALVNFATGSKTSIGDLVEYWLREFAKMQMAEAMKPAMKAAGAFVSGLFAPSANGNVFGPSGLVEFGNGGVVSSPTMFNFRGGTGVMGEAGEEAIMPVKRGSDGKLGVGAAPVSINIINNSGGNVKTKEKESAGGGREIEIMIDKAVSNGIGNGKYDSVLGNSFGIRRKGK